MYKITKSEPLLFHPEQVITSDYVYVSDSPDVSPFQSALTGAFINSDCLHSLISKSPNSVIQFEKTYLGTFKTIDPDESENELYYLIYEPANFRPDQCVVLVAKEGRRKDLHQATFMNLDDEHCKIEITLSNYNINFLALVQAYFFDAAHNSKADTFTQFVETQHSYIISHIGF
jgi:hypothetical protein